VTTRRHDSGPIAAVVTSVVEDVFATVRDVQADALRVHQDVTARQGRLSGTDISALAPSIRAHLRQRPGLVIGLGLIIAPDVLGDESLRLEWWQSDGAQSEPSALEVDLNRLSLGFYDYEAAEWFAVPRRSRSRHVVGPYVDVHGTGSYVLTFTMPVTVGEDFIGVAGADVSAAALESRLLDELADAVPAVILNADDRVVFSTWPRWLAGSRVPPQTAAQELDLVDLPTLPWRLGTASPRNH
jgi:hypothetical protein